MEQRAGSWRGISLSYAGCAVSFLAAFALSIVTLPDSVPEIVQSLIVAALAALAVYLGVRAGRGSAETSRKRRALAVGFMVLGGVLVLGAVLMAASLLAGGEVSPGIGFIAFVGLNFALLGAAVAAALAVLSTAQRR